MRIAVVSDIHGNRTAFEAVLADLRQTSPDLILHGGDLAHGGSTPIEIVDEIRARGWPGVLGNADEMLFDPQSLHTFATQVPQVQPLLKPIEEMAAFTREALGESRVAWLGALPRTHLTESIALVHASPATTWRSPTPESSDADLESVYSPLARPIVVYGHIHRSYIRVIKDMTVINTGSVSLSYDGDPRASYLLLDGSQPSIRRVEYDVEREVQALQTSRHPHAAWIAKTLQSARPQLP
jgi:predicted phosphodiesterase